MKKSVIYISIGTLIVLVVFQMSLNYKQNKEIIKLKAEIENNNTQIEEALYRVSNLEDESEEHKSTIEDLDSRVDDLENRKITITTY